MAGRMRIGWPTALPIVAALIGATAGDARGALLQIQFTGQVTALAGNAATGGQFAVGETVVGRYTVDNTDLSPAAPNLGTYALSNLSVTIGGDYTLTGTAGTVTVSNGTVTDNYIAAVTSGLVGAPVNGASPGYFDVQLDFPISAFSSDAFVGALPLGSASQDRSNINFPDDANRLSFRVLTMSVVPEPALASLAAPLLLRALARARSTPRSL